MNRRLSASQIRASIGAPEVDTQWFDDGREYTYTLSSGSAAYNAFRRVRTANSEANRDRLGIDHGAGVFNLSEDTEDVIGKMEDAYDEAEDFGYSTEVDDDVGWFEFSRNKTQEECLNIAVQRFSEQASAHKNLTQAALTALRTQQGRVLEWLRGEVEPALARAHAQETQSSNWNRALWDGSGSINGEIADLHSGPSGTRWKDMHCPGTEAEPHERAKVFQNSILYANLHGVSVPLSFQVAGAGGGTPPVAGGDQGNTGGAGSQPVAGGDQGNTGGAGSQPIIPIAGGDAPLGQGDQGNTGGAGSQPVAGGDQGNTGGAGSQPVAGGDQGNTGGAGSQPVAGGDQGNTGGAGSQPVAGGDQGNTGGAGSQPVAGGDQGNTGGAGSQPVAGGDQGNTGGAGSQPVAGGDQGNTGGAGSQPVAGGDQGNTGGSGSQPVTDERMQAATVRATQYLQNAGVNTTTPEGRALVSQLANYYVSQAPSATGGAGDGISMTAPPAG